MRPAARVAGVAPSPIRILSEGAPPGAIPLGLGEPGWDLPLPARQALAASRGRCPYGPNAGAFSLRYSLAARYGVSTEEVLVTAGSQAALCSLFLAWLDPGDQVLVPDPGYSAYPVLARLAGAESVPYSLAGTPPRLDAEAFLTALKSAPRTRLAVINTPANPTGGAARLSDLAAVASACASRDVILVSDEVYRELYLGERPLSLRHVAREKAVVLGSISKAGGAPGLRVGWAVGDPAVLAPARTVHAFAVTAASSESQRAALALVDAADDVLPMVRKVLQTRWSALSEAMRTYWGVSPTRPDGSFYLWLPLPASAEGDAMTFCLRLRDEGGVVVVPGGAFGEKGSGHLRLSFAADPEVLAEGIRRLAPFFAGQGPSSRRAPMTCARAGEVLS